MTGVLAARCDAVLDLLREATEPLASSEIARQTGVPQWALNQSGTGALALLEAEGKIVRTGARRGTRWSIA